MTLRKASLIDRALAASTAGFQGIGWGLNDFIHAQDNGKNEEAIIRSVTASKVKATEVEFLREWVGRENDPTYKVNESRIFRLANRLGTHRMQVAVYKPQPREAIIISLKALCQRAATHDIVVQLEFMPYTPPINSIRNAWDIVQAVDEPNAGLLIDTWQWARSGESAESLRLIPPERITSIQLSDALAEPMPDIIEESRHHRCVPGEGTLDLPQFLRALTQHDVHAPLSVEVMSDELDALPADQAAQRVAHGARLVLRNVMEQSEPKTVENG